MKKIFTVMTLIFLFCNVFTSCNNSFLDEVPNHQLSDVLIVFITIEQPKLIRNIRV